jgi:tRNA pseudouridine32 synthase/23S rRNA pseudouridine746 synthase
MNRPRQIVDMEHGKRAVTEYELVEGLCGETAQGKQSEGAAQGKQSEENAQGRAVVALYPQTGRTHQLRIHCAHPDGLGCPIVGDELYGTKGERLMLHAAEIWFRHPITKEAMHLVSPPPFLP